MKSSKNNIDTGRMLQNFITKNRYTKAELGRNINRNSISVAQYLQNSSIQTGILIDICYGVNHNFFQDIANKLPESFSINKSSNESSENLKNQLIEQLREENKVLRIQNELLIKMKG